MNFHGRVLQIYIEKFMKKIKFNEVKALTKKQNQKEFEDLFYFSHRFSHIFTYFFINLSITPNQVTGIFFLAGLLSCLLFISPEIIYIIFAFIFWRLHIILDLCDGEVARYTKQYSFNGAYWDYMIHTVLYPLCFIGISYSLFITFDNYIFLLMAAIGSLSASIQLAVKNTYFRALYANQKIEDSSAKIYERNLFKKVILELISFDYFIFIYVIFRILDLNEQSYISLICIYIIFFNILSLVKFLRFSMKKN